MVPVRRNDVFAEKHHLTFEHRKAVLFGRKCLDMQYSTEYVVLLDLKRFG